MMFPTFSLRDMIHRAFQEEARKYTCGDEIPFYNGMFDWWFDANGEKVVKALWKRILS